MTKRCTSSRLDPQRIVLAGISLGAFLALALAAQLSADPTASSRKRIRALLDVSGGLVNPYDTLVTRHIPPTLILHGAADNIVPVSFAYDLERRLIALQIPHRIETVANEGHWFTVAALPRLLSAVSSFWRSSYRPQ